MFNNTTDTKNTIIASNSTGYGLDKTTIILMCMIVSLGMVGSYFIYSQQEKLKKYVEILTNKIEELNDSVKKCSNKITQPHFQQKQIDQSVHKSIEKASNDMLDSEKKKAKVKWNILPNDDENVIDNEQYEMVDNLDKNITKQYVSKCSVLPNKTGKKEYIASKKKKNHPSDYIIDNYHTNTVDYAFANNCEQFVKKSNNSASNHPSLTRQFSDGFDEYNYTSTTTDDEHDETNEDTVKIHENVCIVQLSTDEEENAENNDLEHQQSNDNSSKKLKKNKNAPKKHQKEMNKTVVNNTKKESNTTPNQCKNDQKEHVEESDANDEDYEEEEEEEVEDEEEDDEEEECSSEEIDNDTEASEEDENDQKKCKKS